MSAMSSGQLLLTQSLKAETRMSGKELTAEVKNSGDQIGEFASSVKSNRGDMRELDGSRDGTD